ncbi:MAG: nicotinate phosphoribosyltransferase [Chloroflexi bacterium]|jgi:nicotinate phosphoribosyltransferase|nr:nicotinate phosphoribosyltransferase [Chloroflexota bacterium]
MKPEEIRFASGALMTDQYQLTMAQLYFRLGLHETKAQFDHFYRSNPNYGVHKAGYCINAGLGSILDWLDEVVFGEEEIQYLRSQKSSTGRQLFGDDFLNWLSNGFDAKAINLFAMPEGRVVHPNVPIHVVEGPLGVGQIIETGLLNIANYQTLIATKAARIKQSSRGQVLLEFGLRRAQGLGAIMGTRAALIGGADFSSNVGASHIFGFPPKGTHAHSMVQVFMGLGEGELAAFQAYADIYPDDCLLLVDTIDTLQSGVPNAIRVFEKLRQKGHKPVGIRLDSGDLAHLSILAAKMLNEAGFPDVSIVLSNDLDELVIWQIITQIQEEAGRYGVEPDHLIKRMVYGVGTHLITSTGNPALDGVYKLVAINQHGEWVPTLKISENVDKTLNPGNKRVWRVYDRRGKATADLVALQGEDVLNQSPLELCHPSMATKRRQLAQDEIDHIEKLLTPIILDGRRVYEIPTIEEMQTLRQADIAHLDPGVLRIMNPHIYHVSLSLKLWDLKQSLIKKARHDSVP